MMHVQQMQLPFIDVRPIRPIQTEPEATIAERFQAFHEANPHVYEALRDMALWLKDQGKRAGMKLLRAFRYGNVEEAICITFASMSEAWLRPLLWYPMCFPYRRINYLNPDGTVVKGVPKGSVITYLGPNFKRFQEVFYLERRIGVVKS